MGRKLRLLPPGALPPPPLRSRPAPQQPGPDPSASGPCPDPGRYFNTIYNTLDLLSARTNVSGPLLVMFTDKQPDGGSPGGARSCAGRPVRPIWRPARLGQRAKRRLHPPPRGCVACRPPLQAPQGPRPAAVRQPTTAADPPPRLPIAASPRPTSLLPPPLLSTAPGAAPRLPPAPQAPSTPSGADWARCGT
jgi:hypothetical protein